mgnify:CR=1 FL=1
MYRQEYERWINSIYLSEPEIEELKALTDEKEIEYRFGKDLEFGTAGMRGIMGLGTNMMNVYTVRRATQGLAEYILSLGRKQAVISYDTRLNSDVFARAAANVLSFNGIKVYLFSDVHPVPMLSFAVRELNAVAGIMITASHNPKEYNGYKVYGEDGAQMSPENTAKVVRYMEGIDLLAVRDGQALDKAPEAAREQVHAAPVRKLGRSLDRKYYKEIGKLTLSRAAVKKVGKKIGLVYTPVNGSGYVPVTTILKKLGIKVTVVEEQAGKDPSFSTVEVPNPEFKETLELAIRRANKIKADVVFGTDPDCDRLGVAVRDGAGEFVALSGNQVGALLLDYILRRLKKEDRLPVHGLVVKSFVSTGLAKAICEDYGVELAETPVGFKFIGEVIKKHEEQGVGTYLLGFEESYGYLKGTYARDKDAVVASLLVTEMAAYYRAKGMTLKDAVDSLYRRYGSYGESVMSLSMPGADGNERMREIMERLRENAPATLGGDSVVSVRDYLKGTVTDLVTGKTEPTGLPSSDVLYYTTRAAVTVFRPSGTEPKIKVYFMAKGENSDAVSEKLAACRADAGKLLGK